MSEFKRFLAAMLIMVVIPGTIVVILHFLTGGPVPVGERPKSGLLR